MSLDRYFNLYNPAGKYTDLMFRAGDGLQSRELNEMQSWLARRIGGVADAIFKDGDILRDADIAVNADTGLVNLEDGIVYLRGAARPVAAATFNIPTNEVVALGVRYDETIITELEDPALRDPAVGTRNYQEPGAARRCEHIAWGWQGQSGGDDGPGQFHAIYTVVNGVLENRTQPPALDAVIQTIARYDREVNGSYIVDGFQLRFLERDEAASPAEYVFSLAEGTANVSGFKVERTQSARLRVPVKPDLRDVTGEPHIYNDAGTGAMVIPLNRTPINSVDAVLVTKQVTETVTRGTFSGGSDTLTQTSVVDIVSVAQGAASYVANVDYVRSGNEVDWFSAGAEPAPGSSYEVTYRYIEEISVDAFDDDTVTVSGAVNGTTVLVNYAWRLPRIDALVLRSDGSTAFIQGVSQVANPRAPRTPDDVLRLADIAHSWRSAAIPEVQFVGVRAVPVSDIQDMQSRIDDLFDLVALERLRNDIGLREPVAKKGVFVDNFNSDTLRDAGVAQTAAIVDGALTLPADAVIVQLTDGPTAPVLLDYALTPVLEQIRRTGSMKINPYMAFEPIPARITLTPAIDRWTVTNTVFTSPVTQLVWNWWWWWGTRVRRTTQIVSRRVVGQVATIRQRNVSFDIRGFGPTEGLAEVRFDDVICTPDPAPQADELGRVTGTFTIPPNIPAGAKRVTFRGTGGAFGEATYVGQGYIVQQVARRVTTVFTPVRRIDPLAQTVTLETETTVGGVDLWFTSIGNRANEVRVQIRETTVGFPNQTVVTEGILDMTSVQTGVPTRIEFPPVTLAGGQEYAIVVLTDDADHALSIAELGKFDPNTGWVTRQPYQIGVLLSSSNASTWTPHQDRDLAFRLLGCNFAQTERTVPLGQVNVTGASDFVVLASAERSNAQTDVQFILRDEQGRTLRLTEGQPLNLSDRRSGLHIVEAVLTGSATASPVLFPGVQLVVGDINAGGSYISRAFPADATFDASVTLDVFAPGTSGVIVEIATGDGTNYTQLPAVSGEPIGQGAEERTFKATGLALDGPSYVTRIRVTLQGTPATRPIVQNLRAVIT